MNLKYFCCDIYRNWMDCCWIIIRHWTYDLRKQYISLEPINCQVTVQIFMDICQEHAALRPHFSYLNYFILFRGVCCVLDEYWTVNCLTDYLLWCLLKFKEYNLYFSKILVAWWCYASLWITPVKLMSYCKDPFTYLGAASGIWYWIGSDWILYSNLEPL